MLIFTNGEDLEGVTRVLDIKYMRVARKDLRLIFAWPLKEVGEAESRFEIVGRCYTVFQAVFILLMGMVYIKQNIGEVAFITLGHTYITVLLNAVGLSRLCLIFIKKYRDLLGDFIREMHLFHFKEKSDFAMETYLLVHKLSHLCTVYVNIMIPMGIFLFNLSPLLSNINEGAFDSGNMGNVTLEHAVYYSLPFDSVTNYIGYSIVFCINWYLSFKCTFAIFSVDLFLSIMVFHIWGHLKILINNIDNFNVLKEEHGRVGVSKKKYYSKEENKEAFLKLRDIIIHHNFIKTYLNRMSDVFGYVLFAYLIFHQTTLCLLLLESSQMTTKALLRYVPLTITLFETLIRLSCIFELLGAMTDKLVDAVYCLPWEDMNTSNRKIVHVLLHQSQSSLNIKAMGMINVGCQTMITILKNSFSYFIMLRTLAKGD